MQCLYISLLENQTPYELHFSKIILTEFIREFPEYCGFCESDLARFILEKVGKVIELQRTHNQLPKHPSYNHNNRQ